MQGKAEDFRLLLLVTRLRGRPERADDDGVVALVGLERELLLRLELELLELLHFAGEHRGGLGGRVNAVGLDRDHKVAARLEEVLRVNADDARLVGLGDVRKDSVHHADKHAVLVRVPGVLHNGDDVRALLGHVHEVAARAVRELDSIHEALRTDNVRDVRHGRARSGAEVEDLGAGLDVNVVDTTDDGGAELRPEGVPHAVLDLVAVILDRNALLAVHRLAGDEVLRHDDVLLAARNEHALVAMGLDHDLRATFGTAAPSSTAAPTTTTAATTAGTATSATTGTATEAAAALLDTAAARTPKAAATTAATTTTVTAATTTESGTAHSESSHARAGRQQIDVKTKHEANLRRPHVLCVDT
eukprot:Opistho-1_new@103984